MAARSTAEPHTASNLATESNSPACVRQNPDQHQHLTEGKMTSWAGVRSTNNQVLNSAGFIPVRLDRPPYWNLSQIISSSKCEKGLHCLVALSDSRGIYGESAWFVWFNSMTGLRLLKAAVMWLLLKVHIPAQKRYQLTCGFWATLQSALWLCRIKKKRGWRAGGC